MWLKIAGVDHTGIGGDFDGVDFSVEGVNSAADLPKSYGGAAGAGI